MDHLHGWQDPPAQLQATGWLNLVGRVIGAPEELTCNE